MNSSDAIDRYFTEHIVGAAEVVDLGPSDSAQPWPERGVWVSLVRGEARLLDMSLRSLWAKDPGLAIAGRPVVLSQLRRMRTAAGVAALFVWSLALYGLFSWLHN